MGKRYLALSVHQLIDFLLREGDIDDRVYNSETMAVGTKMHGEYQKSQGETYLSEVALTDRIEVEEGVITLQGRADGIIVGGECPIIDEIKTTVDDLVHFSSVQHDWHVAQAICYAYMYLNKQGGEKAKTRLTYISQFNEKEKLIIEEDHTFEDLKSKVEEYCRNYLEFMNVNYAHIASRDASAKTVSFPYSSFRPGQRDLAKYVYGVTRHGGVLFSEAPTGTGKTMSTLFPASKAFKEHNLDRIFYLTAKTTGASSAHKAIGDLIDAGLQARDVWILAKEKACLSPGCGCNPDECPFARGYYGKVREALKEALTGQERFTPEYIERVAIEKGMCPFEFQLDLSSFCDFVVADYNYCFDPLVYLERFFDETVDSSTSMLLVDEAHNLLDRAREMYSARLSLRQCHDAVKALKGDAFKTYRKHLRAMMGELESLGFGSQGLSRLYELPEAIIKTLNKFKQAKARQNKKSKLPPLPTAYRDYSREANRFSFIAENYFSTSYVCYLLKEEDDIVLCLYCIDPSKYLSDRLDKVKGAVFFSATMSPIGYQMDALLGKKEYPYVLLSSPFPKENLDLMIAPKISVRYKDREGTYEEVAKYLESFVSGKVGNYFIFFPSYGYLERMLPILDFGEEVEVHAQMRGMTPKERLDFIDLFQPSPDKTHIGLLVLGGAFSEGIDLVDDRLIGVAVVGIGLPQINDETNLIKSYYDAKDNAGFEYAYKDPGMNKVLQAMGRLIRSESDRGAVLLIDDRYLHDEYRDLFLRLYSDYEVVTTAKEVKANVKAFFKEG